MNKLSPNSKKLLSTAHPVFEVIVQRVLERMDIGVTCGHRDEETQTRHYVAGTSRVQYPDSKHNTIPSNAVDLVIYHAEYGYLYGSSQQLTRIARYTRSSPALVEKWIFMMYARLDVLMTLEAEKEGYTLRWGGKWSNPDILIENSLVDLFHWEVLHEPTERI